VVTPALPVFRYHESSLQRQPELIVLIGFMGAGKSSIGRELARRMSWQFVDLDRWIEKRERRRISQIFAEQGESAFRQMETEALDAVLQERTTQTVLALGGGAWIQPANAERLKAAGARVIFLDADIDELRARCGAKAQRRPLFADEERFRRLHADRYEFYMQADVRIDTTRRSVVGVAKEIVQLLKAGISHAS
jgi:shikimate kinase